MHDHGHTKSTLTQAIGAALLGLAVIAAASLIAFNLVENDKTTDPSTTLRPLSATITSIQGDVTMSVDEGNNWFDGLLDASLESGNYISTGEDGFAEVTLGDNSILRLNSNSSFGIVSLNSVQTTIDHFSGELYSRAVSENSSLKIRLDDSTFSSKEAAFLTRHNDEHVVEMYYGSGTMLDGDSINIQQGFGYDDQVGSFSLSLTISDTPEFIKWNRDADASLDSLDGKLGTLEDL